MNDPRRTLSIWQRWSPTTRFSIIAWIISTVLTFLSLGALGYLVYYPVAPLLPDSIDKLTGDSLWPAVIMAGLFWSFGFLVAAIILHYVSLQSRVLRYLLYGFVLWVWAYLIWFCILHFGVS